MSSQQSSQTFAQNAQKEPARQDQSQQWREIGISAVAAAVRQNNAANAASPAMPKAAAMPKRIVTMRDIELFNA